MILSNIKNQIDMNNLIIKSFRYQKILNKNLHHEKVFDISILTPWNLLFLKRGTDWYS